MSAAYLRTDLADAEAPADAIALDWLPGDRRSTVQSGTELLEGLQPTIAARDLLRLAVAGYAIDRLGARARMYDSWTRVLELSVPVSGRVRWAAAQGPLTQALDFLSGDHWQLSFRRTDAARADPDAGQLDASAVCLFSGGLDSLAGAIDLLEGNKRLVLVGHYEGGLAPKRQRELAAILQREYGADAVSLRQMYLRPAPVNSAQRRPLSRERENTMRARSLLFIAAGLAVASAIGPDVPLYVPENGYIGINVPLTWSRPASLSTRTTHPYFFDRLQAAFDAIGLTSPLENPYRLTTKGEMLSSSANPLLLARLAPRSLSCAHPETARFTKRPKRPLGNCGYCYPCLIRRAALHTIGQDTERYAYDIAAEPELLQSSQRGASLRALIRVLAQRFSPTDVLRNGPIPRREAPQFAAVYERGRSELREWLEAVGGDDVRRRLGSAP